MKKSLFAVLGLLLLVGAFWAGSQLRRPPAASLKAAGARTILYYVDPMNPSHTSDKPGKAPCGMDLEPVYADATPGTGASTDLASLPPGTIKVSPEKQQLIGVQVGAVEKKPFQYILRLLGRVVADETRVYKINAAVGGWITKAPPVSTWTQIKSNEVLGEMFSPEFRPAAQALLFALDSKDRADATERSVAGKEPEEFAESQRPFRASRRSQFNLNVKQYVDSLKNLGMGEPQVQEMIRTHQFTENFHIFAPAAGFITLRNISEGQRFERGEELFRIADLTRVWVLADLFERDAQEIKPGAEARVTLPHQQRTFLGTVSKTLPEFNAVSRTLKVRLELDNPDFVLKPDMFVDVEVPVSLAAAVVVPTEAVLDAGLRQTVFVDRGNGYFEPRTVHLGSRVGDQVQVTQGLMPGERIVTSGTFLLDSESRMKLAATGVRGTPLTDPVCGMTVDEGKAKAAKRVIEYEGQTFGFCSDGCKKKFEADPGKYLGKGKSPAMTMAAMEPKETSDPVCGMKVDVAEAKAAKLTSEHEGKAYFFCNETCKKQFDAAPAKYTAVKPQ